MQTARRYVLNVGFILDPDKIEPWNDWLYQRFLPLLSGLSSLSDLMVSEVQNAQGQGNPTYSVLLTTLSEANLTELENWVRTLLADEITPVFGEACLPFLSRLVEFPGASPD